MQTRNPPRIAKCRCRNRSAPIPCRTFLGSLILASNFIRIDAPPIELGRSSLVSASPRLVDVKRPSATLWNGDPGLKGGPLGFRMWRQVIWAVSYQQVRAQFPAFFLTHGRMKQYVWSTVRLFGAILASIIYVGQSAETVPLTNLSKTKSPQPSRFSSRPTRFQRRELRTHCRLLESPTERPWMGP